MEGSVLKKIIALNESAGYGEFARCRRKAVAGRVELLKAFFDGPPFWMVRLRNGSPRDRKILVREGENAWGNFHWRFVSEKSAREKFSKLTTIPEYANEAVLARLQRDRRAERARESARLGLLRPFGGSRRNGASENAA
jgi:hypothetical protein